MRSMSCSRASGRSERKLSDTIRILERLTAAAEEARFRQSRGEQHWATEIEMDNALSEAREFINQSKNKLCQQ